MMKWGIVLSIKVYMFSKISKTVLKKAYLWSRLVLKVCFLNSMKIKLKYFVLTNTQLIKPQKRTYGQ